MCQASFSAHSGAGAGWWWGNAENDTARAEACEEVSGGEAEALGAGVRTRK